MIGYEFIIAKAGQWIHKFWHSNFTTSIKKVKIRKKFIILIFYLFSVWYIFAHVYLYICVCTCLGIHACVRPFICVFVYLIHTHVASNCKEWWINTFYLITWYCCKVLEEAYLPYVETKEDFYFLFSEDYFNCLCENHIFFWRKNGR